MFIHLSSFLSLSPSPFTQGKFLLTFGTEMHMISCLQRLLFNILRKFSTGDLHFPSVTTRNVGCDPTSWVQPLELSELAENILYHTENKTFPFFDILYYENFVLIFIIGLRIKLHVFCVTTRFLHALSPYETATLPWPAAWTLNRRASG